MHEAMRETNAVFGGERCGRFYLRDNGHCNSGLLAFVYVVNLMTAADGPISALVQSLKRYAASGERSFKPADRDRVIRRLAEQFKDGKADSLDGLTVRYPNWWFNVRKSTTEPVLRLNLEANSEFLLRQKLDEVAEHLGTPVAH